MARWLDLHSGAVLAVGWVGGRLHSVIFEVREGEEGGILHLYEENS
jgi:hypothetical protein